MGVRVPTPAPDPKPDLPKPSPPPPPRRRKPERVPATAREILAMFGQGFTPIPIEPTMTVAEFLEGLYALPPDKPRSACNYIMEFFSDCLDGEHYAVCEEILKTVDTSRMTTQGLHTMALMGSHGYARDEMQSWPDFMDRARASMVLLEGETRTAKLLDKW